MSGKKLKKKKKQNPKIKYAIWAGAVLFSYVLWLGFQPVQGTMKLGICRTYAELKTIYPEQLRTFNVMERPMDVRMEYTVMNEFGDTIYHTTTCIFKNDEAGNLLLSGMIIDRKKVDQAEIDRFNKTIPGIVASKVNLVTATAGSGTLEELWRGQ